MFAGDLPVFPQWPRGEVISSTSTGPGSSRVTVELPELSEAERVEYPEFLVSYRSISGDGTTGPWLDGGRVNSDSGRVTLPENLSDGSYEVRVHGSSPDGRTRSQPSPSLAFSLTGVGKLFGNTPGYLWRYNYVLIHPTNNKALTYAEKQEL